MPDILFNAFSFIRKKLKQKGLPFENAPLSLPEGTTVRMLFEGFGLSDHEIEAVMINGKVGSFDHLIQEGDRIALLPPGTPGPHRFLLGVRRVM